VVATRSAVSLHKYTPTIQALNLMIAAHLVPDFRMPQRATPAIARYAVAANQYRLRRRTRP
jgi:hypothetical protein